MAKSANKRTPNATGIKNKPTKTPPPVVPTVEGETPAPVVAPVEGETPAPVVAPVEGETPAPVVPPVEGETPAPVVTPVEGETPAPAINKGKSKLDELMKPYLKSYPDNKLFFISSDGQVFLKQNKQFAIDHQKSIDPNTEVDEYEVN